MQIDTISKELEIDKNHILSKIDENLQSIAEEIKQKDKIKISEYVEKSGMEADAFLKFIEDFLEKNKIILIVIWFSLFALYRITKHLGYFNGLFGQPNVFIPSVFGIAVFFMSLFFLFIAYRISFNLSEKKRLFLLFLAAFIIYSSFTLLSQPKWMDAQGYYDLAVIGAEKSPVYLIQNYHTLNTKWPEDLKIFRNGS